MLAPGDDLGREPVMRPVAHGRDHRAESAALGREPVFDAHRRFGDYGTLDDALCFQLFEPLREHAVAEAGDRMGQIAEAHDAAEHGAQHRARPAPADQLYGVVEIGAEGTDRDMLVHVLILSHVSRLTMMMGAGSRRVFPVTERRTATRSP